MNDGVLKVLFVEDSEDDLLILKRLLERGGFSVIYKRVERGTDFEKELREGEWDVTIVDYKLPSFSGKEALEIFNRVGADIPFILVSGTIGEELAVEMMKAGAHDYIMKNNLPRLVPAVKRELEEAELRRQHRRVQARAHMLAEIVDSTEVGVIGLDLGGNIMSWNNGVEKILKISSSKAIGKHISDIISGDHGQSLSDLLEKFISGEKIIGIETTVQDDDNSIHNIVVTFSNVTNANGQIAGYSVIFHDITLQRKAEKALHDSQRWIMETLNSLETGIVLIDKSSKLILDLNNAAIRMIGLPREKLVGKECSSILCPPDEKKCSIPQQTTAGKVKSYESVIPTTNVPVIKNIVETMLSGKKLIVESFIDITELKQTQKAKEELQKQMQVKERLHSLGLMAGTVSHDFKNFLQVIAGNLEIITMPNISKEDIKKIVSEIRLVLKNAQDLCQELTAFAGGREISLKKVDLNLTVAKFANVMKLQKPENINILENYSSKELPVMLDSVQLMQVFNNIMLNAIQAFSDGKGTITIETGVQDIAEGELMDPWENKMLKAGRYAYFSIEDNGPGIPESALKHIFEPFFSTKSQGRGLGLSSVPSTLHKHSGSVKVDSIVGKGTKFTIYLPLIE